MGDPESTTLWETLLRQGGANQEIAHAMGFRTQRMISKARAVDVELDRLQSWNGPDGDAEAG